ncbi:MAG: hypothetical protein JST21_09770 [Bacteroidetes bacterium]|nr:hypothetical protein [Bacteroidota bacterium]
MLKFLTLFLLTFFLSVQKSNAQYHDSTAVDSISIKHIDSVKATVDNIGSDYNDDGYVDTTVKHIYDTSQFFFNWKTYLDDPYTKDKIGQRHLIDKTVEYLKTQDDFWYINAIEKMENRMQTDPKYRDSLLHVRDKMLKEDGGNSILMQSWFNTLLWVIVIGIFIAALIYFLVQHKINIFSRSSVTADDVGSNDEQEDIFHLSYSKLIQKAEKEKDYRVAVRLMYLQLLKLLSDSKAIQYQPEYTDFHYLQQLSYSSYYNEFSKICRNYEYVWYGKFEISEERYSLIKNDCVQIRNKII